MKIFWPTLQITLNYLCNYLVGRQDPDLRLVPLPLQRRQLDLVRRQLRHVQGLAEDLIVQNYTVISDYSAKII